MNEEEFREVGRKISESSSDLETASKAFSALKNILETPAVIRPEEEDQSGLEWEELNDLLENRSVLLITLKEARKDLANSDIRVSVPGYTGSNQAYFLKGDDYAILEIVIARVEHEVQELEEKREALESRLKDELEAELKKEGFDMRLSYGRVPWIV